MRVAVQEPPPIPGRVKTVDPVMVKLPPVSCWLPVFVTVTVRVAVWPFAMAPNARLVGFTENENVGAEKTSTAPASTDGFVGVFRAVP